MTGTTGKVADAGKKTCIGVVKRRVVGKSIGDPEKDLLAIEDPLEISVAADGKSETLSVTMRTPGADEDLVTGWLFAEGRIRSASEMDRIEFVWDRVDAAPVRATAYLTNSPSPPSAPRNRAVLTTNSSCGVCGIAAIDGLRLPPNLTLTDSTRIAADWIHPLPARMREAQGTFELTGGLHAAAIFEADGDLLVVHEDIGRHNALDKAIGACLRAGTLPARNHVLCVSGRMSYEILQKSLMARIPIIVGVGAPSSLAVTLADDFGVTLIGFARNNSFNIYTHPHRITAPIKKSC